VGSSAPHLFISQNFLGISLIDAEKGTNTNFHSLSGGNGIFLEKSSNKIIIHSNDKDWKSKNRSYVQIEVKID
jgi:hypothetical protein